jgi:hypothetical protein
MNWNAKGVNQNMDIQSEDIDTKCVLEQIKNILEESEEFFLFFNRKNPENLEELQHKKVVCMDDESIIKMIHHLFAENPNFFDKFLDYSEKQIEDTSQDKDCGELTEEEIDTMYNNMIEREETEK